MYKRLFKCVYTEKILKDQHEIHPNPNNSFSYVIGLWMAFIFLFVFSILPKSPQWNQKIKYVFCRNVFLFSLQGPSLLYFDCLPGQGQCGRGCCTPVLLHLPLLGEEAVGKEHQGTGFGESDQCLTSVKRLLIIAPGHPLQQECLNEECCSLMLHVLLG